MYYIAWRKNQIVNILVILPLLFIGQMFLASSVEAVSITYYVRIDKPETHYAHVKIEVKDVGTYDELLLDSHRWEENYLYFENISVYGPNKQVLEYTRSTTTDSFIWEYLNITIPSGFNSFTVEYDVHYLSTFNGDLNSLHTGILSDRAIFDMQHCFFNFAGGLVPFNTNTVDTTISFDIPTNWTVVSTWQSSDNIYQGDKGHIFGPTPSCGEYELSEFALNGLTARVGVPTAIKDKMPVSHSAVVSMVKNGLTKMQDVYGIPSQSKMANHDVVALIFSYSPMATQESGNGTAYVKGDHNDITNFQWSIAYGMGELLKLWLGDGEDTYWARQTMWEYETAINMHLFGYKTSSWVSGQVRNWLSIYKEQIYGTRFDVSIPTVMDLLYYNNSNSLTEEERTRFGLTQNKKGGLFWFVIDEILKKKTSGQKSIYDFFGHMNRNFAGDYSVEDVISALSSIASWDFRQFFTDYYYGIKRLPVENYLVPTPEIDANGSDGPITQSSGTPVTITVSLDTDNLSTQNADWWVAELTPSGTFNYYNLSMSSMVPGLLPTHQGQLFSFGTTQLLNSYDLGIGTHTFYFAVDMNMNGSLDMDSIYYDSVNVIVQ
ncbi:MAG: hypothetical protein GY846_25445 [Deltaproteobacteria bacterium]|nr:hypothetical protein [Deltaproteobacteria bacterium]